MNLVDSPVWLTYFADDPTDDFIAEAIEGTDLLLFPSVRVEEIRQPVQMK